ncbi:MULTISPECIES: bifunctional DNA primase/polymerase [Streptomyces]|uniref:bifunctional DNA primase/polymerase n=1 Tax=Streptomyces TaxID=1883 RepID=UPI000A907CB3
MLTTANNSPAAPVEVARWCASRGWPVHPLALGRKTPAGNCAACRAHPHRPQDCPCLARGGWCHGFHAATTDTRLLDSWWSANPGFGVGVSCGAARLVVVDVDAHSVPVPERARLLPGIRIDDRVDLSGMTTGFDTLALLAAYRGRPDPAEDVSTLRVRTPSGGLHVWYDASAHPTLFRSSTGSGSRAALAWQVDVRADGGYIVAPGTRTQDGDYRPVGPARAPAPLPGWLADELLRTGHGEDPLPRRTAATAPATARAGAAGTGEARRVLGPLLDEVRECAATPEGAGFSEKLNRAAYTAGGLVAAGSLAADDARGLLHDAAEAARPWQSRRNDRIIEGGLDAGHRHPFRLRESP